MCANRALAEQVPIESYIVRSKAFVTLVPGIQGGSPCINNTRLPVEAVAAFWWTYGDVEKVREAYPYEYVNEATIKVACHFLGIYSPKRKLKQRFNKWARGSRSSMPPWEGSGNLRGRS